MSQQRSDQLAARQLLQQSHENVAILHVVEQVVDLDGWVALRGMAETEAMDEFSSIEILT